jgi:DHA1 family inner membrane transport protein
MIASRIVDSWGAYNTSLLFITVLLGGVSLYALGAGHFALMAAGVAIWGLGFASTNSMQQVRLVGADPALGGATVSLNTSTLYIGQAIGSGVGGVLFAHGQLHAMGFVSMMFVALALGTVVLATRSSAKA